MKRFFLFCGFSLPLLIWGGFLIHRFLNQEHYKARFPIDFIPYNGQPRTEVLIEGHHYPLIIDLGSDSVFSLKKEILEELTKTPYRSVTSLDAKGFEYNSNSFIVPKLKIRNITIFNCEVLEEPPDFLEKGGTIYDNVVQSYEEKIKDKPGRIGRSLFTRSNSNILLDFHNAVIFSCCHLDDLKKEGYKCKKLVTAPFELNDFGIILNVEIDEGEKKLLLDTGATMSVINPSCVRQMNSQKSKHGTKIYESSKFVIGGRDFGRMDFLHFELAPIFEGIDGAIGMDFLKEHIVYLDFKNKKAHLGKSIDCKS